jgi:hypothetical protein
MKSDLNKLLIILSDGEDQVYYLSSAVHYSLNFLSAIQYTGCCAGIVNYKICMKSIRQEYIDDLETEFEHIMHGRFMGI